MGRYIVNGEEINLVASEETAQGMKDKAGLPRHDWVMAHMPGGEVQKLGDTDRLPANADNFTVVPAYEYGGN